MTEPEGVEAAAAQLASAGPAAAELAAARAALAVKQAELVAALVSGGAVPAGFNEQHVAAARHGLARKRLGGVSHHFPGLAAGIRADPQLLRLFADWHVANPRGSRGGQAEGSYGDGLHLMEWLDAGGRLPPAATRELLLLRMETRAGPGGTRVPARWWGLRRVTVRARTWWAVGSHRRYWWVRAPR